MGITFSIGETLEMAIQIEKNGRAFYLKAAENTSDNKAKKLFNDLAEMEAGHAAYFTELKEQLTDAENESTVFDPFDEGILYLKAFASGHVFKKDHNPAAELKGDESVEDILHIAITLEKDSIVFYLGIKEMVPEKLGKARVEDIIKEEMSHIRLLSQSLQDL